MLESKQLMISEAALIEVAVQWGKHWEPGYPPWIIFLQGELGAGKTTLVRGFLRGLAYSGIVKSPTYTLVEHYEWESYSVYHSDLYRIDDPSEVLSIINREDFVTPGFVWIEWAEKGQGYLPEPDIEIVLEIVPEGRRMQIEVVTERAKRLLEGSL